jgi:hypothetical protein
VAVWTEQPPRAARQHSLARQPPEWLIGARLTAAVHTAVNKTETNVMTTLALTTTNNKIVAIHKLVKNPGITDGDGNDIELGVEWGVELSIKGSAVRSAKYDAWDVKTSKVKRFDKKKKLVTETTVRLYTLEEVPEGVLPGLVIPPGSDDWQSEMACGAFQTAAASLDEHWAYVALLAVGSGGPRCLSIQLRWRDTMREFLVLIADDPELTQWDAKVDHVSLGSRSDFSSIRLASHDTDVHDIDPVDEFHYTVVDGTPRITPIHYGSTENPTLYHGNRTLEQVLWGDKYGRGQVEEFTCLGKSHVVIGSYTGGGIGFKKIWDAGSWCDGVGADVTMQELRQELREEYGQRCGQIEQELGAGQLDGPEREWLQTSLQRIKALRPRVKLCVMPPSTGESAPILLGIGAVNAYC